MYRQLRRDNEKIKDDVVGLAQELIRIPSLSLAEGALADRIEDALHDLEYNLVLRDDYGNVVGVMLEDPAGPTVLLNSHMDTVAPRSEEWERPPFAGEIVDGKLVGVGAADCKGGLAAQMYAGHLLHGTLLPLKGNLVFAATVAEENGCSVGLRYLLENTLPQLDLKPTFAILGEPTSLNLCYGHDGWVDADLTLESESLAKVEDALKLVARALDCTPGQAHAKGGRTIMCTRPPEFLNHDGHRAVVRVSRRLYAGESASSFIAWVQRRAETAAAPVGGVRVGAGAHTEKQRLYNGTTSQVKLQTEAWSTDPFDPMLDQAREALLAAGCECAPRTWWLDRLGMGTAGSVLVNRQIPTVGFGPGEESQAHAGNESCALASLTGAVYGTAVLAHRFIGARVYGVSS
ncbi:MAG TPA: M20/M25/M40 family metallo-hydrolase [Polyangia bacterium]|jgi:acetylornithine deacetylase/succinyl-diaminopimelate desuccinylase-like protein